MCRLKVNTKISRGQSSNCGRKEDETETDVTPSIYYKRGAKAQQAAGGRRQAGLDNSR